jgi:hypothetical protein
VFCVNTMVSSAARIRPFRNPPCRCRPWPGRHTSSERNRIYPISQCRGGLRLRLIRLTPRSACIPRRLRGPILHAALICVDESQVGKE